MAGLLGKFGKYAKGLTAVAGGLITVAVEIWGTDNHWVALVLAVATAAGVVAVPNKKQ